MNDLTLSETTDVTIGDLFCDTNGCDSLTELSIKSTIASPIGSQFCANTGCPLLNTMYINDDAFASVGTRFCANAGCSKDLLIYLTNDLVDLTGCSVAFGGVAADWIYSEGMPPIYFYSCEHKDTSDWPTY